MTKLSAGGPKVREPTAPEFCYSNGTFGQCRLPVTPKAWGGGKRKPFGLAAGEYFSSKIQVKFSEKYIFIVIFI